MVRHCNILQRCILLWRANCCLIVLVSVNVFDTLTSHSFWRFHPNTMVPYRHKFITKKVNSWDIIPSHRDPQVAKFPMFNVLTTLNHIPFAACIVNQLVTMVAPRDRTTLCSFNDRRTLSAQQMLRHLPLYCKIIICLHCARICNDMHYGIFT